MNHLQCTEKADNPTTQKFKLFYSLAALIIQYMTPLVIVTIVYYRICLSIRDRKERAIQKICLSQIIRANMDPQNDKYESLTHTNDKNNNNNNISSRNNYNDNIYAPKNTSPTYYQKTNNNGLDRQKTLLSPSSVNSTSASQKEVIDRRHRKAIILSTVIAIVFCLSWLPINTLNVISDMRELEIVTAYDLAFRNLKSYKTSQNISTNNNNNNNDNTNSTVKIESTASSGDSMSQHSISILKAISKIKSIEANNIDAITVIITQALCLLLILSSACVNPILYGWLNKSFRSEFYQVFHIHSTILPNIKSSHKNITQDNITSNRNNETGHRHLDSEQAEYVEQLPTNYHYVNPVTTTDTATKNANSNHKHLMKKIIETKKSTEKRSLSSTQDSCTVFSLFTSRSVELNSAQISSNSGSNNTTNNNNNNTTTNNSSNTNGSYDTLSQTIRNSFISKNAEDHSTASNEISVQMNYEQDHIQSAGNNRNTNNSNSTNVNTSLKRCFLLDKTEDEDECDIIPESDSITDPTHLRYLPDITSV
ncbi:unnamed protein product [Trichobilharzia szidati]|nr:unnamed protein product [Trichobilharzia szidati]